ncbi:MAG TPA: hypothetical protein DCO72_02050 [Ruminococcus sp.]|nr:hypothetical protein [Ruminococcus sp.]
MNYKVKGIGVIAVVAVGAVCLVGGAVGGYLYGRFSGGGGGFGLGGSEGGSALIAQEEQNNRMVSPEEMLPEVSELSTEDSAKEESVPETEIVTEPVTIPIIENMDTVEVVVSGNGYLYRDTPVSLEALKGVFQTLGNDYTIKVTDKKASLKAYNELIALLQEKEMHYIEVT